MPSTKPLFRHDDISDDEEDRFSGVSGSGGSSYLAVTPMSQETAFMSTSIMDEMTEGFPHFYVYITAAIIALLISTLIIVLGIMYSRTQSKSREKTLQKDKNSHLPTKTKSGDTNFHVQNVGGYTGHDRTLAGLSAPSTGAY